MAAKKAPGNNGPETSDDAAKGAAAKKSPRGGAKAGGKSGTSGKAGASIGVVGMLRWFWRQLTTMRTALFLLLLVAIAAVPGSIFPQRSIDATRVTQYEQDHPDLFPWLDRLGMFNVYSTPWFAAIYLLLAVSLIGCIIPRTKVHWKAMRSGPPKMPRNIKRLPAHRSETVDASPDAVAEAAREVLRRKRFKLRKDTGDLEVASEGGMLRESGNLLFHLSIVGIIVAVAGGHVWGWRGDVIVPDKSGFTSTMTRYDTLKLGPWVDLEEDLPDWSLKMDSLKVTFEDKVDPTSPQWGQPRDFTADVHFKESPEAKWQQDQIRVNHPLKVGGGEVYLLGNGYAPKITYKDAKGNVLYDQSTPFLAVDNQYKSTGAFKIPGASPDQVGLFGFFLPTAYVDPNKGPSSAFPDAKAPALYLGVYKGDLYPNGRPQSVFSLDTEKMTQVKDEKGQPLRLQIALGQTVKLPNNMGSVTFESVPRWAGLSIRHDPGKLPALIFSVTALAGLVLSLMIRRRRVFVRVRPASDADGSGAPRTVVEIGGLAKGEDPRLALAVDEIFERIQARAVTTGTTGKA
ncbi:cytochrome c biogenesis protein ResB [Dermacoccus barathri]|uniref:Cytochrome c biogenesis protein ResB n=1 Tax=Dermacoccus barathri TaxID=322601 RepID=A0ABN2B400_9MICO